MLLPLSALSIFAFSVLAVANPVESNDPYHSNSPINIRVPRSSLIRLRDSIIQAIWKVPSPHCSQPFVQTVDNAAQTNFRARYGGDVVLRFNVSNQDDIKELASAADTLYLDVWESTDEWVDVRLAKQVVSSKCHRYHQVLTRILQVPSLLSLLPPSLQRAHTPLMHDLVQAIYESYPTGSLTRQSSSTVEEHTGFTPSLKQSHGDPEAGRELFFRDYQPLSVIDPWMRLMASLFPTHTRLINIGISYEGRDIKGLKVGVHPTNNDQPSEPRKTILVMGGSHAREWIGTSTVNYLAYSLITRYGRYPAITKLIEEFDWVFIPTINPDGYAYTWDSDRLWRKNRQQTEFRFCRGIDLDRSFSFQWDGESTISNPCSESYAGGGPFEAVEAKRLADWAKNETDNNNVNFVSFLDLHSYSQQILYPYSYSCNSFPPSLENLEELAMNLAQSIRLTSSQRYGVSSACEGSFMSALKSGKKIQPKFELGGGSALDWFYHELFIRYAYQIKLRDTGTYGFLLPKSAIVPTGQETYNAIVGLGRFLLGNKGIEFDWAKETMGMRQTSLRQDDDVKGSSNTFQEDSKGSHGSQDVEPKRNTIYETPDNLSEEKFDLRRRRRR